MHDGNGQAKLTVELLLGAAKDPVFPNGHSFILLNVRGSVLHCLVNALMGRGSSPGKGAWRVKVPVADP
jgi:hypothetical protein